MTTSSFLSRVRAAANGMSNNAAAQYVAKFLYKRPLQDHNYVKQMTEAGLKKELPVITYKLKPYLHQLACIFLGLRLPAFLFFLDMGAGKTMIALALIRIRMKAGTVKKSLILVPNVVNIASWVAEINKHAPELKVVRMDTPLRSERQARMQQEGDIWIVNYAGLQSLMTHTVRGVELPDGGRAKGKRTISDVLAVEVAKKFDCVIFDESHKVGNTQSLSYKLCLHLSQHVPFRYAMTGTPFGRDPMLLWGQFYLIDHGETLSPRLTLFRDIFFRREPTPYGSGIQFIFRKSLTKELNRLIQHRSILYKAQECANSLPKLVEIRVPLEPPKDMQTYYAKALDEARNIRAGNYAVLKNVFMRMRQISSGFVRLKDAVNDEKVDIAFGFNPKMEALRELVDQMPEDCKMVVFHDFLASGKLISEMLTEAQIGHMRLYGATKDKEAVLNAFNQNPKIRVLVCNSASGGTGTNLQVANYVVFYESPVSSIARIQAEKRCHRTGQEKVVYIYDLVMSHTMDARILDYIKEGKDLIKAIVEKGVDNV